MVKFLYFGYSSKAYSRDEVQPYDEGYQEKHGEISQALGIYRVCARNEVPNHIGQIASRAIDQAKRVGVRVPHSN